MAQGIRRRKSADGKHINYQVRWRDGGGRGGQQRSVIVSREHEAAKRLFTAGVGNGNHLPEECAHPARRRGAHRTAAVPTDATPAAPVPLASPSVPTFAEYAARHVDNLTGGGDNYRGQHRKDVARHMMPMFGDLPHTEIDEDTARAWLRGLEAGTHPWLRAKAHRFPALAPPEWRRLQAELPHGSARDLATVLVSTGLRFGEVTALQAPGM